VQLRVREDGGLALMLVRSLQTAKEEMTMMVERGGYMEREYRRIRNDMFGTVRSAR
jgi:hypothetical protein